MASINERFMDFQVAQQIRWIRLQNTQVRDALRTLRASEANVKRALDNSNLGEGRFTVARLNALKVQINEVTKVLESKLTPMIAGNVRDSAVSAAEIELAAFERILPAGLDVTTPNLGVLQTSVLSSPFNGAPVGDWTKAFHRSLNTTTWTTIVDGITSGMTNQELTRSLLGTASQQFKDGALQARRRGLEALVRTSTNHATNQGRQQVWATNSSLLSGVRWVATLDMRTSPICQERDGKVGPVTDTPGWTPPAGAEPLSPPMARPPAHVNCRSTTTAVVKSWKELGFKMEELPAGTRASMNGQVPANMTYFEWLGKQSAANQKEILGQTRYDIWKKDGIAPDRFINDQGVRLTLDQIRNLKPATDLDFTIADYTQVGKQGDFTFAINQIPQWKPTPWTSISEAFDYDKELFSELKELSITGTSVRRKEILPLKDILSVQQTVRLENLAPIINKFDPTKIDAPPVVYRLSDGKLVLRDGNHRVNAAMANGVKDLEFDVIDYTVVKPKVARLSEFGTQDTQLGWFEWKKDKTLPDMFDQLDASDFGLVKWPVKSELTDMAMNDGALKAAIGKVAVQQMRGSTKFEMQMARQELRILLSNTEGKSGPFLGPNPSPMKIAEAFDLTDFTTASATVNKLNKFEHIYYLDPTEFGLDQWPSSRKLLAAAKADSAGMLGDIRMIVINHAPTGQPKRYMTTLKKRVGRILDPAPVVVVSDLLDIDGKPATIVTKAEFLAYQKKLGVKNAEVIRDRWEYYESAIRAMKEGRKLLQFQHGAYRMAQKNENPTDINRLWDAYTRSSAGGQKISRNNTQPKPFKVGTGNKLLTESVALERKMQKAYDVMPNWVLNEIKDVTKPTLSANKRAYYSPWSGELHLAATDGADIWVHEMFHALDFKFRYRGKPIGERVSVQKTDSLDWATDDENLNRLAAATRAEFKTRDGKGVGSYKHNSDGDYWLGNWENSYEGRKYEFDVETSSEYITMGAQSYAAAKMRGETAFQARREVMKKKQPAMLALLDHIWTRMD